MGKNLVIYSVPVIKEGYVASKKDGSDGISRHPEEEYKSKEQRYKELGR